MGKAIDKKYLDGLVGRMEKAAKEPHKGPRYSTILWDARAKLEITANEYLAADIIHKLSSMRSKIPGWCWASKKYLGDQLGVSERGMFKILNRLKEKGVVETHPEQPHLLRTTQSWFDTVEVMRAKTRRPEQ